MDISPQDRILEEFEGNVKKVFPDIFISSGGYGGLGFHVGILGNNRSLRQSKYFTEPQNKEYFHLTSYKNVFSIINSGYFRLYNLKNSDDPNELASFKKLGISNHVIDFYKKNTFILSGCGVDDIENEKLWRGYGKVAIVYEFLNSSMAWNNFHFAPIQYKTNPAFSKFAKLIIKNNSKYPGIPFNYDVMPSLIAFHKRRKFRWEKEVRLMFAPPISSNFERFIDFKTSKHHTGYTEYIQIPIYRSSSENIMGGLRERMLPTVSDDFYNEVPLIKIKRIIFGDNEKLVSQKKYSEIKNDFKNAFQLKFGYRVDVSESLFEIKRK